MSGDQIVWLPQRILVRRAVTVNGRRILLRPGWYRRRGNWIVQVCGWRLVAHRLLWGFDRLVDAR